MDTEGNINMNGWNSDYRPKFEAGVCIVEQYIRNLYKNKTKFNVPMMNTFPLDKLYIKTYIDPKSKYSNNYILRALSEQYGSQIDSNISVLYIMTTNGPILLSKMNEKMNIDYKYYTREINKHLGCLSNLI